MYNNIIANTCTRLKEDAMLDDYRHEFNEIMEKFIYLRDCL
jgi:hypothetical protein